MIKLITLLARKYRIISQYNLVKKSYSSKNCTILKNGCNTVFGNVSKYGNLENNHKQIA